MAPKGKQFPFFIPVIAQDRVSRVMDRIKKAIPDKLRSGFGSFATGVSRLTTSMLKGVGLVVGGATAALGGLIALVNGSAARGDSLVKLADRIGLTVEALQQWDFAAQRSGLADGQFGAATATFAKRLGELKAGRGALLGLVKQVSPDLAQGLKEADGVEDALRRVLKAIGEIEDGEKRMALSAAAFSKANSQMVNLAMAGPRGLQELLDKADALGVTSEANTRRFEGYNDAVLNAKTAWKALLDVVAGAFAPTLTRLFDQLATWLAGHRVALGLWAEDFASRIPKGVEVARGYLERLWMKLQPLIERFQNLENKGQLLSRALKALAFVAASPLIAAMVNIVLGLGQMVLWFGSAISKLGFFQIAGKGLALLLRGLLVKAVTIAGVALKGLFTLLLANPIGLVVTAIGAVVLAFYKWDTIKGWVSGLWDWIKKIFSKGMEWVSGLLGGLLDLLPNWFGGDSRVEVASTPNRNFADVDASIRRMESSSAAGLLGRILVDFQNAPQGTRFEVESTGGPEMDLQVGYSLPVAG